MSGANTATDLLVVRAFSPLATYVVGDFVHQALFLYRCILAVATPGAFTPANWEQVKMASDPPVGGPYLPLLGGTLTGPLILAANATNVLGAVPLQQLTAGLSDHLPLIGGALTGDLTVGGDLTVTGDTVVGELTGTNVSLSGSLITPDVVVLNDANNVSIVSFFDTFPGTDRGAVYFDHFTQELVMLSNVSGERLVLGSNGPANHFFRYTGDVAEKVNSGGWTAIASDARVKNVQGDYTFGLDEVLQLRPRVYTYKGNDTPTEDLTRRDPTAKSDDATPLIEPTVPYPASPHYSVAVDDKPFVGFIAQEVEQVFPSMVTQKKGFIDGQPVDDLRGLDTSELLYALVNSVKTLAARVEALEGNP